MSGLAVAPRAQGLRSLRAPATAVGALVLLGALTVGDVLLGPAGVDPSRALALLFWPDGSADSALVQSVRLPRAVSGLAVGMALGVAGALLQAAVRNPLAEPGTIGVNAGAALGVTLAAVLGVSAGALTSVPFALAGGGLAALIVLGLGRGADDPVRLILAGVAVAFAFMGAASRAADHLRPGICQQRSADLGQRHDRAAGLGARTDRRADHPPDRARGACADARPRRPDAR